MNILAADGDIGILGRDERGGEIDVRRADHDFVPRVPGDKR